MDDADDSQEGFDVSKTPAPQHGLSPLNNRLLTILMSAILALIVFTVLSILLVVARGVRHGSSHPGGAASSALSSASVAALSVRFTPNPAHVHAPLSIHISGLHPGEGLRFVFNRIPRTDAFGGPMGTFYANMHGTLHFVYPAFRFEQEQGPWRMVGFRSNGTVAVSREFRVIG